MRVYQESKSRIAAAYRDQALVQRMGAEATFAARHAQQVNERVTMLQAQLKVSAGSGASAGVVMSGGRVQESTQPEGKPSGTERVSLERIVLQEEDRLRSISIALGLRDLRDLPLEKQVEEIRRAAKNAANQPNSEAIRHDLEARLESVNKGLQQGVEELARKDRQLAEKDSQLAVKNKQLAEKDRQLKTMKEKLATMKLM
jgi:chromosome segregation ATPase